MKHFILLTHVILVVLNGYSQSSLKWWNPAEHDFPTVEGQAWPGEVEEPYDRLPARANGVVRDQVWNLSKHSAGLLIRFRSNAARISVRYTVSGNHAMNHMPATGVSGVDLYAIDSDGNWNWSRGNRNFSDTITYDFQGLKKNDQYHEQGREYRLYLPLYNHVNWLEIGVDASDYFKPLPVRQEKPIVVYGTSIAHGACASRPGMAWANILQRKMDRPLINLGFSGNGRLEPEVVDFLTEIDPKIYIVDCLPNLTNAELYDDEELSKRIKQTVRQLKEEHPETPVLLAAHAGYTNGQIQQSSMTAYTRVNKIQKETFDQLIAEGVQGLYYITREQLGIQLDDMVDGTHPNDLGMMHYAEGYESVLREILHEATGNASTTRPVVQYREPGNYDWEDRHRATLEMNQRTPPKTVILANSIIHFWGGLPRTKLVREEESWSEIFTPMGVRNFAYGWDRIENVLWRIYHGELDGFQAEKVVVIIGTNNLHLNTDNEILEGLGLIVDAIKVRQPGARPVIMGLLPRRDQEPRIVNLNKKIEQLASGAAIQYQDIGKIFLKSDGSIDESLFSDGLHPNEAGYLKMRVAMQPLLE